MPCGLDDSAGAQRRETCRGRRSSSWATAANARPFADRGKREHRNSRIRARGPSAPTSCTSRFSYTRTSPNPCRRGVPKTRATRVPGTSTLGRVPSVWARRRSQSLGVLASPLLDSRSVLTNPSVATPLSPFSAPRSRLRKPRSDRASLRRGRVPRLSFCPQRVGGENEVTLPRP